MRLLLQTDVVCCRFGFVVVAVLTWLQIMCRRFGCRRFAIAVLTCRCFDRVPHEPKSFSHSYKFRSQ